MAASAPVEAASAPVEAASAPVEGFASLPEEIHQQILQSLDDEIDLARSLRVCRAWHALDADHILFKLLYKRRFNSLPDAALGDRIDEVFSLRRLLERIERAPAESIQTRRLVGHEAPVDAIRLLKMQHDGDPLCISASRDKSVRLWQLGRSFKEIDRGNHQGWVWGLDVLSNPASAPRIFSGSWDCKVGHWTIDHEGIDSRSDSCPRLKLKAMIAGATASVLCISALDDVVAGCFNKKILLYDIETSRLSRAMTGHGDSVLCVQRTMCSIFSGSGDKKVKMWDPRASHACLHTIVAHDRAVKTIQHRNHCLVTGSTDTNVKIFDDRLLAEPVRVLSGVHTKGVNSVLLDENEIGLLTASDDGRVVLWDAQLGEPIKILTSPFLPSSQLTSVAVDWARRHMLVSSCDNVVTQVKFGAGPEDPCV